MQINSDKLQFVVGDADILNSMAMVAALPIFSDKVVDFLAGLSRILLRNKSIRSMPDVISYAYWIRKASLESAKEKHRDRGERIGRGVAFHIAPSNVPVNFAVSMTSSLLAGNATLIRISNKQFAQVDVIAAAINKLLNEKYSEFKPYICLIRYEHDEEITKALSAICDLRVIWGGNNTIKAIRNISLPSRAIEMAFADRHSIAIINSDAYMRADADAVAEGFYTDTYYTDQNACSSPRLVVWTGNQIKEAKNRFWDILDKKVVSDYKMQPIQAVDKYTSLCMLGMVRRGLKCISQNNYIVRVAVDRLTEELMDYKNGGGYFFEYEARELEEIIPVLTKECQTVSVFGIRKEDIRKIIFEYGVRGVDRIVSLGQTMGLEFIWDGYKMIENMSRFVYVGRYE